MNFSIRPGSRLYRFPSICLLVIFCLGCSTTFKMDEEPLDSGITFESEKSVSIYTRDKHVLRMHGHTLSAKKIDGKLLVIDGGTINGRFAVFDAGEVERIMKGDKQPTYSDDFLTGYLCFVTLGFSGCGIADRDKNKGYSVTYSYPVTQNDYKVAFKWYWQAANRGNPIAMAMLGDMYTEGRGVARDKNTAHRWYKLAVAHGIAESELGSGYLQIKAESIHNKAEQGDVQAQNDLGEMYETGQGVNQDYKAAFEWSKLAAEQGHADAQFRLGWMYMTGHGVAQDDNAAIEWYKLAAEQGHTDARATLNWRYETGQDDSRDY